MVVLLVSNADYNMVHFLLTVPHPGACCISAMHWNPTPQGHTLLPSSVTVSPTLPFLHIVTNKQTKNQSYPTRSYLSHCVTQTAYSTYFYKQTINPTPNATHSLWHTLILSCVTHTAYSTYCYKKTKYTTPRPHILPFSPAARDEKSN